ncbi:MAG: ATP-grasp domain-containing protein [Phycisphaerae bacterium]|nr:ATP-grasp domain-containing protein [Phycisphaerae bacterium]
MELLDAFRRAMEELDLSGKLVATDITLASPACHKADAAEVVPNAGRLEYIPALVEIVKKHDISLVVPMTDLDLRSLARQKEHFQENGCTVMVGSEKHITLCQDKARTNEILPKAGLSTIRTMSLAKFRTRPFYPCFIKPIRGSASVGTSVIHNKKELKAHIATFGELMIVQEYVPGQEYTIDVYRSRDGKVRCVVPRQRLVVRSGEVEKGITIKDKQLIKSATTLAGMLGDIWGVLCCQCRRHPGNEPRFFEINPRFGGGSPLSIAAGANLPLYLLQEVLGEPITAEIGDFTDRLMMLRYDQAIYNFADDPTSLPGYNEPLFR